MADNNSRPVNFFKPESPHAKANALLVACSVILWAVLVFGFQFLLVALNKPTPEPAYGKYTEVWPAILSDSATDEQNRQFAQSVLMVLGKNIAVKEPHKQVLKTALSVATIHLCGNESELWGEYLSVYDRLKTHKVGSHDIPDAELETLFAKRDRVIGLLSVKLGLADTPGTATGFNRLMADLLPFSLVSVPKEEMTSAWKVTLPPIMDLYLIHNRNVLTDTTFLGFPFHYWYTSQFLLIMFVMICLVYGLLIDRINRKYNFVEDREPEPTAK